MLKKLWSKRLLFTLLVTLITFTIISTNYLFAQSRLKNNLNSYKKNKHTRKTNTPRPSNSTTPKITTSNSSTPSTKPTATPTTTSSKAPAPTSTQNNSGSDLKDVFFDDFNYNSSSDSNLTNFGYEVRDGSGGPGINGCQWSKSNISFLNDTEKSNNKFMRLKAITNGTASGTIQSELTAPQKFLYGTYAAKIKFYNTPESGPDGDQIVETFFTISPWSMANDTNYGECDFEYLANGGWGKSSNTMWNTTWETATEKLTNPKVIDLTGWHTCVMVIANNEVKYYIDGNLYTTHNGIYYPETPMNLSFNLWFVEDGFLSSSEKRTYIQDIDWVYHSKDMVLDTNQIVSNVDYYRNNSISRKDTIK